MTRGRPTRTAGTTRPTRPTSTTPEQQNDRAQPADEERVAVARKSARPGRRLIIFAVVVAALYGGVALGGVWKPKLGLDLQGGTRITLEASASGGEKVTSQNLEEARGIIDQRVNGSGVAEAEVGTQGANNIVVEIPGQNRQDLVDTVKQTAQLRFRLVAAVAGGQPQPQ